MYKKLLAVAVAGGALLLSGCAGFKANNLPPVSQEQLQFTSTKKTKIYSRWKVVESNSSMLNDQGKAAAAAVHKKNFDDAIAGTGCCDLVEGPSDANVVVDGVAHVENNPAALIPAVITGLSLYTIPSWVTAKSHITADVKNGMNNKSYELQDSMTMVQWLPLIFAMPFSDNPIKAEKQMGENTHKTLVLKMKEDGLF